ncbi:MAG: hypothetical protein ACE5EY_12865, partial [Anaerolineae bacterium]
ELLLLQAAGQEMPFDGTAEQKREMLAQAQRAPRGPLIEAIKTFNQAAMTSAGSWQPQLPLELAFIEMLPETAVPVAAQQQAKPAQAEPAQVAKPPPAANPVSAPPEKKQEKHAPVVEETAVSAPTPAPPQPESKGVGETAVPKPKPEKAAPLSLASVKTHWRGLVDQAGARNRNLPALLNMGKPLATEGNVLVLGFDYPIFKEKFDNTQGAAQLIGDIVTELTGINSRIRCVITSEYMVNIGRDDLQALADELGGVVREE